MGVRVTGLLEPSSPLDTYAVTTEEYNRGGYRSVADENSRLAISEERRKVGMLVKEISTGLYYTLESGITNSHWKLETLGGGGTSPPSEMKMEGADVW